MRFLLCAPLMLVVAFTGCTRPSQIQPSDLRAFTTDGCSGGFPEGPPCHPNLWCDCCVAHDLAYWKGGTWEQREAADSKLSECVAEKGRAVTGIVMKLGCGWAELHTCRPAIGGRTAGRSCAATRP